MKRVAKEEFIPQGLRLGQVLEYKSLSQTDFARMCGLSAPYVSQIISGLTKINHEAIINISKFREINMHWFLTGEGSMLDPEKLNDNESALMDVYRGISEGQRKQVFDFAVEKQTMNKLVEQVDILRKEVLKTS